MHLEHYRLLNKPGQDFRVYVGIGNEIRIGVDGQIVTPPPTTYPEQLGQVPFRPTAVMGPNRIGFVGEPVRFYGGYSYQRWREAAVGHTWEATGSPIIDVQVDVSGQLYPTNQQENAVAIFIWNQPGIYTVTLTVQKQGNASRKHTATRQVIVYPSREQAYSGVTEISNLTGSISGGGWSVGIKAKGDMSWLLKARDILGYLPLVIMVEPLVELARETFVEKVIGRDWEPGNYRDDPRIVFNGYIDRGSIETTADGSSVVFQARTADMILEQAQTHTWGFFESAYDGAGKTFNDLQVDDVVRHMLQENSNFTDYNDLRLYYNIGQIAGDNTIPNPEYKDWTFQAGMFWSNIRDAAENEFKRAWADCTGAICMLPDRNMWPPEAFADLTAYNRVPLPVQQAPIGYVLDHWSEDYPGIIPSRVMLQERVSAAVSYYKIIANLSFWNEEWGADHPKDRADMHSGKWILIQGKYLSDQNRDKAWASLWRFAARGYAASNARYTLDINLGMFIYWRLGDMVGLWYQDPQGRQSFGPTDLVHNKFEVESISHTISVEAQTWTTAISLREVTVYAAPTPDIPATPSPPATEDNTSA